MSLSLAHLHVPEDVWGGGAALGAAADVHGLALCGHRGAGGDDRGPGADQHRHLDLNKTLVCSNSIENSYVCITSTLITTEICLTCY